MKLILHANENCKYRSRLKGRIEHEFPEAQMVSTSSKQHLSETLCRPLHNFSVLIALMTDSKSASVLLSLVPLFENIKLILIFCNEIDEFEKSILLLEPLYISYPEANFQDVVSVLHRIEQKQMHAKNQLKIE